jgi:hypothetical protein
MSKQEGMSLFNLNKEVLRKFASTVVVVVVAGKISAI